MSVAAAAQTRSATKPGTAPTRTAGPAKPTGGQQKVAPPAAPSVDPAVVTQLRALVFRGQFRAAEQLGRLGAVALPTMREALQDADPKVVTMGAFIANGIGRPAVEACPTLLTQIQRSAWDTPQGRDQRVAVVYPFGVLAALGCDPQASAAAVAGAATRMLSSAPTQRDPDALDHLMDAVPQYGDVARAPFVPVVQTVLADSEPDAQVGRPTAWYAASAYRLLAQLEVWSPEIERLMATRMFPTGPRFGDQPLPGIPRRDFFGDSLSVRAFRFHPDRAIAVGQRQLTAQPDTNAWLARLHRMRAYHLLGSAGAEAFPTVLAGLRRDIAGADAAEQRFGTGEEAGMAVPGFYTLRGALDALRQLGPAGRPAMPVLGEILQSNAKWAQLVAPEVRETVARLRAP